MTQKRIFNLKSNELRRRDLRHNMPEPERRLWNRLRGKQLGVKFRRQHGIGPYIADFYCPERKLVIELDGDSHASAEAQQYDAKRNAYMNSVGLTVLRFTNSQVMTELDAVVDVIFRHVS